MTIWSRDIDNDREQVIIEVETVQYRRGNFDGGALVCFEITDKLTTAFWCYFDRGALQPGGRIRTWDRALTEGECLRYCEDNYGRARNEQSDTDT